MHGETDRRRLLQAERDALVRTARTRMTQFIACGDDRVTALATLTEAALHDAIAAGVGANQLAAELDLSLKALAAILDRCPSLLDLHPNIARTMP